MVYDCLFIKQKTAYEMRMSDWSSDVCSSDLLDLGDRFYDPVEAARFPETRLRFRNDRAAASVGLDTLSDAQWIAHFGRFEALPDNLPAPLALRYHGHQFRNSNPDIGDGRGFLFAQLRDYRGRLMDLGTNGSGTTGSAHV